MGKWLWTLSNGSFFLCSCFQGQGDKNGKICQSMNSIVSREELIREAGEPYRTEVTDKGTILYYRSNPFAAGPVRFVADPKTGRVIGKKCFEDEEWVYFKEAQ